MSVNPVVFENTLLLSLFIYVRFEFKITLMLTPTKTAQNNFKTLSDILLKPILNAIFHL